MTRSVHSMVQCSGAVTVHLLLCQTAQAGRVSLMLAQVENLLKKRLEECGWWDNVKAHCKGRPRTE